MKSAHPEHTRKKRVNLHIEETTEEALEALDEALDATDDAEEAADDREDATDDSDEDTDPVAVAATLDADAAADDKELADEEADTRIAVAEEITLDAEETAEEIFVMLVVVAMRVVDEVWADTKAARSPTITYRYRAAIVSTRGLKGSWWMK